MAIARLASAALPLLAALCVGSCGDRGAPDTGVPADEAPWFRDVTDEVGLDFVHGGVADDRLHMPAVMAGGAAFLDYDNDDDLDIFLTNGHELAASGQTDGGRNRLYRREPDGRYTDVTVDSGLGDRGYGMGVAVGDYDNDGDVDLYVSNFGPDRLFRNEGNGRFTDVTVEAGVAVDGWSASAAFCDFDRDGFLDLYVTRYVEYRASTRCSGKDGRADFCGPKSFRAVHDVVLHNRPAAGGGRGFADVSDAAGIDSTFAAGLGVVCLDMDDDGWQDVYVANDAYANQLWRNLGAAEPGTIRFRDDSLMLGIAYNLHGQAQAGMGVIAEDLDGNGTTDLFLTHLMNEANTLYDNLGGAAGFRDVSGTSGLGPTSLPYTGFGVVALDTELDGDLDLFIANGKVNVSTPVAESQLPPPWNSLPEHNQLFLNDGSGAFAPAGARADVLQQAYEISRGAVGGDMDGDGDVDILVANLLGPARLYRNEAPRRGHWVSIRVHDPDLARDALGARVTVTAGGRTQARPVGTASSYLSSQPPQLHFGLGNADQIDSIEVRWPDGRVERFSGGEPDRAITLFRGAGERIDG